MEIAVGPTPRPSEGEVLIRVAAAGINRADVMQRLGNYPPPPGASPILGLEVAGTIVACGPGSTPVKVGDSVCALVSGGGYAEYCVAPAVLCLPVPGKLTLTDAAAVPEAFFTVWANVFRRCRLAPGESLLVHGGSSGIGTTAIQLAKALGSMVYVTAGSAEKCARCVELGADAAINYREQDFAEEITRLTGKREVDVILDMVGAAYLERNLKVLAVNGRLVHIAMMEGNRAEIDLRIIMAKRLTVTGSTLRPLPLAEKAALAHELREKAWPLLENGRVKPIIQRVFPFSEVAEAHRLMESSSHVGKIVLAW
jgi:putative PIG3 family NAD(P)H quinone oxidoreductase